MKTALTVWENRISPVFDSAHMLLIAEIKDSKVISRRNEPFDSEIPSRLRDRLIELDVAVLICGAISELPAIVFEAGGIKLIPFIAGYADEVLEAFAKGLPIIPAYLMPGCGCKRRIKCNRSNVRSTHKKRGGEHYARKRHNRTSGSGQGNRKRQGRM